MSPAELMARLDADLSALSQVDATTTADSLEAIDLAATLDASLVEQMVSGIYLKPGDVRGAAELIVPSSADKTLQPVALYVPTSYTPARLAPVILMLHGQGQTESQLLATPFLRALAEQTGSIFAAPYARGDQVFDTPGITDVYDALALLQASLRVDHRRVYLCGYSLGGFGVFIVAPQHAQDWTALLAVAGTLTNDDKTNVVRAMAGKQVFLVIGADDPLVKAEYVRGAAAYLTVNGVETGFYEQPGGLHSLQSLQPAVERAWRDMFSGVRNVAPTIDLPSPQPMASKRT